MAGGDLGWGDPHDELDSPAEVAAAARTQRRIALGYGVVFVLAVSVVPVLSMLLPWWSGSRAVGGMSPNFLIVGGGLYGFFLVLGGAAATRARSVEGRMLGSSTDDELSL